MPANSKSESRSAVKAADPSKPASTQNDTTEVLQKENEDLRRTNQYRSLFLARLAHELRTPLTSILGFSEILLGQEKLTDAQRGFCERIQSSAQQLQAHLNQLSDLARLESGQTKPSADKIAIADTLLGVLPALARSAEKKGLKLRCEAAEDLPVVISDRARVRQLIYNALAYAVSRSPEGAPVKANAKTEGDRVVITIRDAGEPVSDPSRIGILTADDNSNTSELGLSIARQNAELLGGSITARNLEKELELRIELPFQIPA